MILGPSNLSSWFFGNSNARQPPPAAAGEKGVSLTWKMGNPPKEVTRIAPQRSCPFCLRRHFLGSVIGKGFLFPDLPSFASVRDDPVEVLNRIHPPRPDWYEEFYASAMDKFMKPYEAEIAGYKSELLANLRGTADRILEIGVGTGPNFKYYVDDPDTLVFGIDPNRKMEKYAESAAAAAGLPPSNFTFIQAVGEALPFEDSSVDAVVGTLVLCSVKDVDRTLQEIRRVLKPDGRYIFIEHVAAEDGSLLRFLQGIIDPLQQAVADGCHLTRKTSGQIVAAGFGDVHVNQAVLSTASFINPHVYGIARR